MMLDKIQGCTTTPVSNTCFPPLIILCTCWPLIPGFSLANVTFLVVMIFTFRIYWAFYLNTDSFRWMPLDGNYPYSFKDLFLRV